MEKIFSSVKHQDLPRSGAEKKKSRLKIFQKLEEAFASFDETDQDDKVQFVIKGTPKIPSEKSVTEYLLKNALLLIDNGDFKMARHILADILKRDAYHAEAIRWLGWCFKQEGEMTNALKCYEQLVQIRNSDQDYYELGEIYYELKNDLKARDTWITALLYCNSESPRLFDLHKNLGNSYLRLGDIESAEENYNKAFTLRPQSDALQVNLGSLHFYKKDLIRSLDCFKQAIDINPYNDRAWCGVALVAREKGDNQWAYSMVLKSLDINCENLIALQTLVNWALVDKNFSDAVERVQIYCHANQKDTAMLYTLAALYFQNGDILGAEIELEKLLHYEPENTDALQLYQLLEAVKNGRP